jgi:SOS response regulatory protein OraA/RecX
MSRRGRQSGTDTAFDLACRWLGRARRSEKEVRVRLSSLGFSLPTVEKTVCRLCELHFLDDGEFARTRAQALAVRGYGNAWIERDLKERGLPDELVESAIALLASDLDRATDWIERRAGGRAARAVCRSLLRRGFRPEDVECALSAAGGEYEGGISE